MRYILKNWIILIFLISIVAIISAFIAEHVYDLKPCKMCLNQRYTYYGIIFFTILFYFFHKINKIWFFIFIKILILYGLFYSIWHVGVEQKILKGSKSCTQQLIDTNSIENLKNQITKQPIIDCSEVVWKIFGLSAASVNSILLIFILLFNTIYLYKIYYKNEKIK